MGYIMMFVKPICIGMIVQVLVSLSMQNYVTSAGWPDPMTIGIGLVCFYLLRSRKMSVPKVIGVAAVLGLVCFGIL